jgi:uncharacterized LabA/DUF88 family protein
MGALLLQWNYEKWALGSDLAAKVQGEILAESSCSNFPWRAGMPLLGKTWEPTCHPYHFTFGLVVTASVHPQLSGTRSLIPDNDDPALLSGGRLPVLEPTSGFDDTTRVQSWTPNIMEPKTEKIALFIDGANLYATAKSLGFDIDYKRLLREFHSRGYLLRAFYYTAVIEDQEYSSIRPLIDWLDYNGYAVVTKATKEFVDQTGRRKVKGNMDIELAVDAMEIAGSIDHMVLFSGDGDFRSLVEAVQRRGVRVTVVSTISTQPPMVADELRRQADVFLDIVELQPKIGRDPAERAAREAREPRGDRHTPQFLQRSTTPQRAGAGAGADDDDDFED